MGTLKRLLPPGTAGPKGRAFLPGLCIVFLSALFFYGCAKGPPPEPPYHKVLDRWSGGVRVHDRLESRLYLNATYKSEEFRKAYIRKYSGSYALGPEREEALLAREIEQAEQYNEFFFTAYTPDETLNDFDRKDSVWQVYIEDGSGNRARPITISEVEGTEAFIREFFPYFDLWSKAYLVRFPKYSEQGTELPGPDRTLKLVVTGVMGRGEIAWQTGE